MEHELRPLLDDFIKRHDGELNIISLLQETQRHFGYIPEEAIYWLSEALDIPAVKFFGVATFYSQFYLKPRGKNIITACCGTACHVKGSERVINAAIRELGLGEQETTTEDMQFSLEQVACVGACSIAPVVIINKKVFGKVTSSGLIKEINSLR
ncbi:MAG: NAD(P)H-dependent oxidoreductase subunit E [Nitrospirae bacterium]|nr:NAD(P)H-dependent oxidoreductase subunit E [Nitrospirota bacterium]